jgi:predicted  nucleic acid-binding Zn-ribbon protein
MSCPYSLSIHRPPDHGIHRKEEEARIQTLLQEMSGASGEVTLSAKAVGNIVGLQYQEIQQVVQEYDSKKSDLIEGNKTSEVVFKEKTDALEKNLEQLRSRKEQLTKKIEEAKEEEEEGGNQDQGDELRV